MKNILALLAFLLCTFITQAQTGVTTVGPVTINGGATLGGAPAASFSPVFSSAGACTGGGTTCTVTLSVVPGQFAICGIGNFFTSSGTLTCADTDGDTLTNYPTGNPYSDTVEFQGGLAEGALTHTNASEVFTCTQSNGADAIECGVMVFTGTPTSGWDVAIAGNSQRSLGLGNTTLVSGTSTATTTASELAVGFFVIFASSGAQTLSTSGSWIVATNTTGGDARCAMVYQILTTTGTQQAAILYNNTASGGNAIGVVSTIK